MVLWNHSIVQKREANDRENTINLFQKLLARSWTLAVIRELRTLAVLSSNANCVHFAVVVDIQFDKLQEAHIS